MIGHLTFNRAGNRPVWIVAAILLAAVVAILAGASDGLQTIRSPASGPRSVDSAARGTPPPVRARLSFAGLHVTSAPAAVPGGLTPVAADPADPSTVAWCAGEGIGVSNDGVMATLLTAGVDAALRALGFVASPRSLAPCTAVAPLAAAPGGPVALAAAFSTSLPAGGAFYDIALYTLDGGQTWHPVPVPAGASAGGFGGFRYRAGDVEAVFAATVAQARTPRASAAGVPTELVLDPDAPLAELSDRAGLHWHATGLGCPSRGPCVTLGPYLPGNCAVSAVTQPVLRSADGGLRWTRAAAPGIVGTCAEAELVGISAQTALLVDSVSPHPLAALRDGGASWTDVALPRPAGERGAALRAGAGGIVTLPGGSLLLSGGQGYTGGWELLEPGGHAWCRVSAPAAVLQRSAQASPLTVIGGDLWWLTSSASSSQVINELPLSTLAC